MASSIPFDHPSLCVPVSEQDQADTYRLVHPVGGQPLLFEAPLPPECSAFLKGLDVAPV